MISCRILCQIVSNCWTKSSIFCDGCNHLFIMSKMHSVRERSSWWRKCGASLKTIHSKMCHMQLELCWKISLRFHNRKGNTTSHRISSSWNCAVTVPEMIIRRIRLLKAMITLILPPYCGSVWLATVRARFSHCPGHLQTRLTLSSGHSWKQGSSLKTIRPQSGQFHIDWVWHKSNWTWQGTGGRGQNHNSQWDQKFCSLSHLLRVTLDSYVGYMVDGW